LTRRDGWRIKSRTRRGLPVRDPSDAAYAIEFAERELARYSYAGPVLICIGVLMMVVGWASGHGALFAAGGGPLGAGIAALSTPTRLTRSIEANQELRFQARAALTDPPPR
jgi:hypothetical protein